MQKDDALIIWPAHLNNDFRSVRDLMSNSEWKKCREKILEILDNYQGELSQSYLKNNLGVVYINLGIHNLALECFKEALALTELHHQNDILNIQVTVLYNLAYMYYRESGWDTASYYAETAVALVGSSNPDLLDRIQLLYKNIDAGRKLSSNLIDQITTSGDDPVAQVTKLRDTSRIYADAGAFLEAVGELQKAIDICRHQGLYSLEAICLNDLGTLFQVNNIFDKARSQFERAIQISSKINDQKTLASVYNNFGLLLKDQGQLTEAIETFQIALKIKQEMGEQGSSSTVLYNIAKAYFQSGEMHLAGDYAKRALAIDEQYNPMMIKGDQELIKEITDRLSGL